MKVDGSTAGGSYKSFYISIKFDSAFTGMANKIIIWQGKQAFKNLRRINKEIFKKTGVRRQGVRAFYSEENRSHSKKQLLNKIEGSVSKLCKIINTYSEEEMDKIILPHPLLGKLTLREMMYFTAYHIEHHYKTTIRNLEANNVIKIN